MLHKFGALQSNWRDFPVLHRHDCAVRNCSRLLCSLRGFSMSVLRQRNNAILIAALLVVAAAAAWRVTRFTGVHAQSGMAYRISYMKTATNFATGSHQAYTERLVVDANRNEGHSLTEVRDDQGNVLAPQAGYTIYHSQKKMVVVNTVVNAKTTYVTSGNMVRPTGPDCSGGLTDATPLGASTTLETVVYTYRWNRADGSGSTTVSYAPSLGCEVVAQTVAANDPKTGHPLTLTQSNATRIQTGVADPQLLVESTLPAMSPLELSQSLRNSVAATGGPSIQSAPDAFTTRMEEAYRQHKPVR